VEPDWSVMFHQLKIPGRKEDKNQAINLYINLPILNLI
jgi:hypothetical protein